MDKNPARDAMVIACLTAVVLIAITIAVSYLKRSKKSCEDETLVAFLESPEKIKKFSEYISAYYDEYEGTDAKTKNAIMEEVFVNHVSHIIEGLIKNET